MTCSHVTRNWNQLAWGITQQSITQAPCSNRTKMMEVFRIRIIRLSETCRQIVESLKTYLQPVYPTKVPFSQQRIPSWSQPCHKPRGTQARSTMISTENRSLTTFHRLNNLRPWAYLHWALPRTPADGSEPVSRLTETSAESVKAFQP